MGALGRCVRVAAAATLVGYGWPAQAQGFAELRILSEDFTGKTSSTCSPVVGDACVNDANVDEGQAESFRESPYLGSAFAGTSIALSMQAVPEGQGQAAATRSWSIHTELEVVGSQNACATLRLEASLEWVLRGLGQLPGEVQSGSRAELQVLDVTNPRRRDPALGGETLEHFLIVDAQGVLVRDEDVTVVDAELGSFEAGAVLVLRGSFEVTAGGQGLLGEPGDRIAASQARLTFGLEPEPVVCRAAIDVDPFSDENIVNRYGRPSFFEVALLGSEKFDVQDTDVERLRLFPGDARVMRDPTHAFMPLFGIGDYNADGFADLLLYFRTAETDLSTGDTQLCLHGFVGADPFEACDEIEVWLSRYARTTADLEQICGDGFALAAAVPGVIWVRARRRSRRGEMEL